MTTPHIFVSYSRGDLPWVQQLAADLEADGLPVWLDVHKLKPGMVWDSEVERALVGTDILLVVLSEHSAASANVLDEINFALSKNRLVVPVLYRVCDVPYRLGRLQHIDFTVSRDVGLRQLKEHLHAAMAQLGKEPIPRPEAPVPAVTVPARRRPAVAWAAAGAVVLLLGAAWVFREPPQPGSAVPPEQATTGTPAGAAATNTPAVLEGPQPAGSEMGPSSLVNTPPPSPAPRQSPAPAKVSAKLLVGNGAPAVPPTSPPGRPEGSAPDPAPTPAPAALAVRDEESLVRGAIALYARALNERNLGLLAQVRPGLSRPEAEDLVKGMQAPHTVSFGDIGVTLEGAKAVVLLTRRDVVADNRVFQTALKVTLRRQGEDWVIEQIERTPPAMA